MSDYSLTPPPAVAEGERITAVLSITWIAPGPIAAGEEIVPARIGTDKARGYGALHLIARDMAFAAECFNRADALGLPQATNVESRALIGAGTVAYARGFKSGVRVSLDSDLLAAACPSFDRALHDYLVDLRDKHIAHSVNAFESAEAVAVMVGRPDAGWRDGSGVGVTVTHTVGITRALVRRALRHFAHLRSYLDREMERLRPEVYADFARALAETGKWEMAPMVVLTDRSKVGKRRP